MNREVEPSIKRYNEYHPIGKEKSGMSIVPEYGISASLSNAAAEWSDGMDTFARTELIIVASLREHVRDCAKGNRRPCSSMRQV